MCLSSALSACVNRGGADRARISAAAGESRRGVGQLPVERLYVTYVVTERNSNRLFLSLEATSSV